MPTKYTSKKLSLHVAEQFKESFSEPEPTSIGYIFVGNHIPYLDETNPEVITESPSTEKQIWKNMFAAKKITGADTSLVVNIRPWVEGRRYLQYDDQIARYTSSDDFYVMNSNKRVFKCLSNNYTESTFEPDGDYTINSGVVETSEGYIWKYIYGYSASNRFLSDDYISIPSSATTLGFNTNETNLVDGAIYTISVENSGTDYKSVYLTPAAYGPQTSTITLENVIGVANGMYVTGTGIQSNTTVTSLNVPANEITLSRATANSGGGNANDPLNFYPRVSIIGDGSGATANITLIDNLAGSNTIDRIYMTNYGTGYSYATVQIYSAGTAGSARAIIGPKYGHGFNPARELAANTVMILAKIGEFDATENGLISDSTTIRQYGLLRDPHAYGNTDPLNSSTADAFISQTYAVTLVTGPTYTLDELVYQGSSTNKTFSGYLNSQTASKIQLTRLEGSFSIGGAVIGQNSLTSRSAIAFETPSLQPYTGDILYVDNITYIQRTSGQTENLKMILKF